MEPKSPVIAGMEKFEKSIAKEQEEYKTLPVLIGKGGLLVSRWEPTQEERERISLGADIYVGVLTGGHPLQPLIVTTDFKDGAPSVLDILTDPQSLIRKVGDIPEEELKEKHGAKRPTKADDGSGSGSSSGNHQEEPPEVQRTRSGRTTGGWV
jgi:hypothetical protein